MKKMINYLVKNKEVVRDNIAILLYRLNLIPQEYKGRVRAIYKSKLYEKDFKKLRLKHNIRGFYQLDPMPSKEFLSKYYLDTYWQSRTDKQYPIRLRDIEHYKLLKKIFPEFDKTPKNILNFGAGHGGLSFFLHTAKHHIYNYEPGGIKQYFSNRWESVEKLDQVKIKFDLIYGSHTLEHVQNIEETLKLFNKISHDKTIFFFEVPNCFNKVNQKVEPPHTYYFTRKFFNNFFLNCEYCKTFKNYLEQEGDEGEVIILLSQSKINEELLK